MKTKAEKRVDFGIIFVLIGGILGAIGQKYLGLNLWEVGFISFLLTIGGLNIVFKNAETTVELVPERRYKLLHYSDEYVTLEYQDAYETKTVHTFKYVKFYSWDPNSEDLSHKPIVGNVYTACKEKGNNNILLKERED